MGKHIWLDEEVNKLPVTEADVGIDWDIETKISQAEVWRKDIRLYPNPCKQMFYVSINKDLLGADIKI